MRTAMRALCSGVCAGLAASAAADPVNFGGLVLDAGPVALDLMFPDAVSAQLVFGRNGIGGFGGSAGSDSGEKFFGLSFDIGTHGVGGIEEECFIGCGYFGAEAKIWGSGQVGAKYRFQSTPGSIDIRYPVSVVLDLPYGKGGGGLPTIGQKFSIGASWFDHNHKVLPTPGLVKNTTPLLASHGPSMQTYLDVGLWASAGASGEVCFFDCVGDGVSLTPNISKELFSINRNGSGVVRVLDKVVNGETGGGGIVTWDLRVPKLDAKDTTATGGMLQTGASGKVVGAKWDIDKTITALTGFPLTGEIVDLSIADVGLKASYILVDASAQLNAGVAQTVSFAGKPMVTLDFSAPVQRLLGSPGGVDQWSAPTQQLHFAADEGITLRAPQVQLLAVVPSYSFEGTVTNTLSLELYARADAQALKLESTITNLGPLFGPAVDEVPLASVPLLSKSFEVDIDAGGGQWFNLYFKPGEGPAMLPQYMVLGFLEPAQWAGSGCSSAAECAALPQTKIGGLFDISSVGVPSCFFDDGCDADVMQSFLQALAPVIARGSVDGSSLSSALRLLDERGNEVFLDGLALLDDVSLDVGRGYAREALLEDIQALAPLHPLRDLTTPVPEPGAWAMLALGLAGLVAMRRRAA